MRLILNTGLTNFDQEFFLVRSYFTLTGSEISLQSKDMGNEMPWDLPVPEGIFLPMLRPLLTMDHVKYLSVFPKEGSEMFMKCAPEQ